MRVQTKEKAKHSCTIRDCRLVETCIEQRGCYSPTKVEIQATVSMQKLLLLLLALWLCPLQRMGSGPGRIAHQISVS
jgi:hypothetical protein